MWKIRLEHPEDYQEVETMTRDAFWNKYRPGCMEHYVLHAFRDRPEFVTALDYVVEDQGQIVGHIMYVETVLELDGGGTLPILVFGPVSVRPERQGEGIGSQLIRYSMEQAARMGYGAVAITGNPGYYSRFGFEPGTAWGIYYGDVPREQETPFFMVRELRTGYLHGVQGTYHDPEGYLVSQEAVEEFDRLFPWKEKLRLPGQLE